MFGFISCPTNMIKCPSNVLGCDGWGKNNTFTPEYHLNLFQLPQKVGTEIKGGIGRMCLLQPSEKGISAMVTRMRGKFPSKHGMPTTTQLIISYSLLKRTGFINRRTPVSIRVITVPSPAPQTQLQET